jgi:hypothetical protein
LIHNRDFLDRVAHSLRNSESKRRVRPMQTHAACNDELKRIN